MKYFFNDVRINKYLVGKENAGFKQIMAQVDFERAGMERLMQNYPVYKQLIDYTAGLDKKDVGESFYHFAESAVAQIETDFNVGGSSVTHGMDDRPGQTADQRGCHVQNVLQPVRTAAQRCLR